MKTPNIILISLIILTGTVFPQRRGTQEVGGGVAFWTKNVADSSESNLELIGLWATYFNKNFLFEILPSVTLRFREDDTDVSGTILAQLSHKLVDLTSIDRQGATQYQRRTEQSTGGIFISAGGGLWLESGIPKPTSGILQAQSQVYNGLAVAAGLGTHSMLGSLTKIRSKFQFVYLLPTEPLYSKPRSMISITLIFSVISVL